MLENLLKVNHIILLPKDITGSRCTAFQGFSQSLVTEYTWIFSCLCDSPINILDYFCTDQEYIKRRICNSGLFIHFLREDLLDSAHVDFDNQYFSILWSTDTTFESAEIGRNQFRYSPLHISSKSSKDETISSLSLNKLKIDIFLKERMKSIAINHPDKKIRELFSFIAKQNKRKRIKKKKIKSSCHSVFYPNLNVLLTYGYQLKLTSYNLKEDNNYFISNMKRLAEKINSIKRKANKNKSFPVVDAIIYCPSIYGFLYNFNSKEWKNFCRNFSRTEKSFIRNGIVRIKGYSRFSIQADENYHPENNNVMPLAYERSKELNLFTNIISIFSASQFSESFRLPHSVMLHHDILKKIEGLLKSSKNNLVKLKRIFFDYSSKIKDDIGTELLTLCFKKSIH
jgi:hypothetical protein